jgi:hypothetical protein
VEGSISAPVLETELSEKFHRPIHVVNLASPNEGRNLQYLLTRELLENHPQTKILLVSVVERADMTHPAFRYLADVSDLLRAPLLINHFYFSEAAFLPLHQMTYFLQTYMPSWFGMSRSRRTPDQACPLLLAAAGRKPPHAASVWEHAAQDRGAAITSRIDEP